MRKLRDPPPGGILSKITRREFAPGQIILHYPVGFFAFSTAFILPVNQVLPLSVKFQEAGKAYPGRSVCLIACAGFFRNTKPRPAARGCRRSFGCPRRSSGKTVRWHFICWGRSTSAWRKILPTLTQCFISGEQALRAPDDAACPVPDYVQEKIAA